MSRAAWGLGSIYQRKDGRWVVQVYRDGKARAVYGRTPAEAREKLRRTEPSSRSSSPTLTVAAFISEWLAVMTPPRLGVRTHEGYAAIAKLAIVPVLGELDLSALGRRDVEAFVSQWAAKKHPRTVQHYLACLRTALAAAVEWGYLPVNPAARVKTPRIPESRALALTAEQETAFLGLVREDPLWPLWLAAFRTGMRQGELLGLRWADVDTAKRVIHVRHALLRSHRGFDLAEPKTRTSKRDIPIGQQLVDALEAHRRSQMGRTGKLDQGLVFATEAGSPLENDRLSTRFRALALAAGIDLPARSAMHVARHTFATRLLERGERIDVVQKLLGHSTITTTIDLYAHVTEDAKRSAVARLEGLG